MPTMLIDEPLGITCVFSDGSRADFSLDGLPNPHLARDLAIGLIDLVHPHGTADSAGTVNHYVQVLRQMVRVLAGRGSPAAPPRSGGGNSPSSGWAAPAPEKRAPGRW
ncbi:hypothetical protein [Streptomyces sp. Cmuel-A718b]|uniref:hypothetical protein n=1 Tax=Streptomyces sp. Cmuel-A718b TaxID=697328 RepID=UPI00081E5F23|nr:hypothetical protein [Streptomyces sp. Cmuel-A718b]SCF58751.1 hypothetical protein GA0115280_102696 [Streptomyces sp. Cmuel-A718b]